MKKGIFALLSSIFIFLYTGCSGSIEEYKPLSQVKPVKKSLTGETNP